MKMQRDELTRLNNGEEAAVERRDGVDGHVRADLPIWWAGLNRPASKEEVDGIDRIVSHGGGWDGWERRGEDGRSLTKR